MEKLFTPYKLGDITLSNRVVMAPMTRSRADKGDTADELTARYYQQRASAGLIVSEGSQISVQGQGYAFTPGIYNEAQVRGWALTTKAVHDKKTAKSLSSSGTWAAFRTPACKIKAKRR